MRTWFFEEPVTSLSLTDREELLVVVLGSRVILWEPVTGACRGPLYLLQGWPAVRLNDARCDPRGSLWAGSMRNNVNADGSSTNAGGKEGKLVRLDPDGEATYWREGIGISNTLAWSPDCRRFYFGDTLANVIWVYDYDPSTGAISNERPFLQGFSRGSPDGSTVDADGYLWNCRFGGNCIIRVAPDGEIDRIIEMPVQNVTTCTFGGQALTTLFVTTARADAPHGDRLGGSLFAIETKTRGQPENRFSLKGGQFIHESATLITND